jgi:hypothetical protein
MASKNLIISLYRYLCELINNKGMNKEIIKISKIISSGLFLVLLVLLSSCEKVKIIAQSVDPDATWSLSTDIQPIFTSNCISCHGGTRSPDLRSGKSFASLTNGGYVTAPAESSKLYSKMTGSDHNARSTDTEKLKVLYWIEQGALNN